MQSACAVLYYRLRPLWLCLIFQHYPINSSIFGNCIEHKTFFLFPLQMLSATFLIPRRIQRSIIICAHRSSCKAPVILVRFLWNLNFLGRFSIMFNWILRKSVQLEQRCSLRTDGQTNWQTDRFDEANNSCSPQFWESASKLSVFIWGLITELSFDVLYPKFDAEGARGESCFCSLSVHSFGCRMAVLFKLLYRLPLSENKTCTPTTIRIQNMYTYNYHNTKRVHLQLSQYKTYTPTTITIQNMYTYNYHNTKHVHLQLSQYKTCTPTTITIQNVYTYNYHNTKHVHLQLSQYKTCTPTTITIQNMYTYNYYNTKHVHLQLSQFKTCTPTTITIQNMYA